MEKDYTNFLNQLMNSLEEAEKKLERAYGENDLETFSKSKNFILEVQKKMGEIINGS